MAGLGTQELPEAGHLLKTVNRLRVREARAYFTTNSVLIPCSECIFLSGAGT